MTERIILAAPRGFCAGVDRAIDIVEKALQIYGTPVYVRHQIVHNNFVVKKLEEKGAIFVETLDEVPDNAWVIFSAHGVPPSVKEKAKERGLNIIDATCPLVTKVHLEAVRFHKEGYSIILIGHKGHQEVIGTMGEAPMQLVETLEDLDSLTIPDPSKVALITQTTLSVDDTKELIEALKEKYPEMHTPPAKDICYATQNRQDAIKALSKECDLILVIGARNSSNSNRLVETAIKYGSDSYLIDDASKINEEWLQDRKTIGISSGASVPEVLVDEVKSYLEEKFPRAQVGKLETIKENMVFARPKEITNPQV